MGKKDRNRKRKMKQSKKHANDKNKTESISASNTNEETVDGMDFTKGSKRIVEETRAAGNMLPYATELSDEMEDRNTSSEDITSEEQSSHGQESYMSDEEIKKKIDAIEKTVTNYKDSFQRTGIKPFRQNSHGTNSILGSYQDLDIRLIDRHRNFFANEARIIRLNEKNVERLWNIFFPSNDGAEQDYKTKSLHVSSVLKTLRYTKITKEENKVKNIIQVSKSFSNTASDNIVEPKNLPDNSTVEKKCKKEGNGSIDNIKKIQKSSNITDPTWKYKVKTVSYEKTKNLPLCDPKPDVEKVLSQQKNELDGNKKTCRDRHSEQILLEENISSGKEPLTHASKSEYHNKITDIENHADKITEVATLAETDDKPKEIVRNLQKNDKISFVFVNNTMVINAGGILYEYTLEKKQDITLHFSDKNIRISFTGNQMLVKTPNSEFDISFLKSETIN